MPAEMPEESIGIVKLLERQEELGLLLDRLDTELREVARAVKRANKAGSLTIKIDIKPEGGDGLGVKVTSRATEPQPDASRQIMYVHRDGSLHPHHWEQKKIDFDGSAREALSEEELG